MIDPMMHRALELALSATLLAGSVQKLRDLSSFFAVVEQYRLLPAAMAPFAGLVVVAAEIIGGLLLLSSRFSSIGAVLAIALLIVVSGAIVINLLRDRAEIACGCGGLNADQHLSWTLVARNAALIAVALLAFGPESARTLSAWDQGFAVAGALGFAGIYATASSLLATLPQLASMRVPQ